MLVVQERKGRAVGLRRSCEGEEERAIHLGPGEIARVEKESGKRHKDQNVNVREGREERGESATRNRGLEREWGLEGAIRT